MSTDPVSEPVRRADDDVLERLAAIDQRRRQISIHLATIGTLHYQLDETRTNLETLIGSLASAGPIVAGAAHELPGYRSRRIDQGEEPVYSPGKRGPRPAPGGPPAPSHARNSRARTAEIRRGVPPMIAPDRPVTPGEALERLFLDNADRGANVANDELVAALCHRARAIQAPADMVTPHPSLPETTARRTRPHDQP